MKGLFWLLYSLNKILGQPFPFCSIFTQRIGWAPPKMANKRPSPTMAYAEMREKMLSNPTVRAEVELLEREERPMLDAILNARKEEGLT
ncbi:MULTISPECIES: hypothetical protein [Nitrosomonas]|uniref:Uncharacterized protein n=1 Tax=Nitrosomonas communis TaxID=44574 RepID=A0A5D3YHB9_9PROT|nr:MULTISPECIES: hypothetical protein [Nitrosomonas]TYP91909.1 hypothetical protein BCL69_100770 [Nitrosomonas communis]UVS61009.1 hypothetical protein NX761_16200 [Nitrosomonas sp. PLL12]